MAGKNQVTTYAIAPHQKMIQINLTNQGIALPVY